MSCERMVRTGYQLSQIYPKISEMVGQAITSVLQVIICPTTSKNSRTGYAPPKKHPKSLEKNFESSFTLVTFKLFFAKNFFQFLHIIL